MPTASASAASSSTLKVKDKPNPNPNPRRGCVCVGGLGWNQKPRTFGESVDTTDLVGTRGGGPAFLRTRASSAAIALAAASERARSTARRAASRPLASAAPRLLALSACCPAPVSSTSITLRR